MALGFVVIGRNEGERLRDCLRSMASRSEPIVYVDSGSTDGSVELATCLGAVAVELDDRAPFTAARGRNAGFAKLRQIAPETALVQFVDGDCELVEGWIETAHAFLDTHPGVAVVCGRRRERYPDQSVYNWLCDIEWDTPVGEALACGGDAMMRMDALVQVGGYRADVMAGEEPELCVRLRGEGWKIWRLDADMTLHDARIMRFGQWWRRMMRGGHAYAEVSNLHRSSPERFWRRQKLRSVFWAGILPVVVIGASFVHHLGLLAAMLYPVQIARVAVRSGAGRKSSWVYSVFMMLAKFAEFMGILRFWWRRWIAKGPGMLSATAHQGKGQTG
jgi:GT2 family glycosyltransferase